MRARGGGVVRGVRSQHRAGLSVASHQEVRACGRQGQRGHVGVRA